MKHFWQCPHCTFNVTIETDDDKYAEWQIEKIKKNHKCKVVNHGQNEH